MTSARSKDDSDIAKYFKDSLVFLSKDASAAKENKVPNGGSFRSSERPVSSSEDCTVLSERRVKGATSKKPRPRRSKHPILQSAAETTETSREFRNTDATTRMIEKTCNGTTDSSIEILSGVASPDRCRLASWGLPAGILRKYEARGLTAMFEWQVECLSRAELLEKNRNLVYSAPTSAGKTLVAEILVMKTMIERRRKVIFILPFVSVVREKMYYFQDLLSESGLRVEGYMGGCAPVGGFAATDLAIATIEKANSLINQLMEDGKTSDLGAVVIDELHLLGDPNRGYLLELLLTKLKYMNTRDERASVQLIGMSATLPNLPILAEWLDAELYKTDFRPVPLNELCKIGNNICDNEMKVVRELVPSIPNDSDNIVQLCIETMSDGHSVLIFCPTKSWCEKLARQIASRFSALGREDTPLGRVLREQLKTEAILETLEQLKRTLAGLDEVLRSTVSFGTAFHHAGLTMDERDVVEGAFRSGALRVLAATSTLSSGVNLPARRVIVRSLVFHGKPLDTLTYRQMIGRAGRMGKDTAGESILVCKSNELRAAGTLLNAQLAPIASCLDGSAPLMRALLEAIASEVAYTSNDIRAYVRCTLVSVTSERLVDSWARDALEFLERNELLMLQTSEAGESRWIATPLGKACLAASVPPNDGLLMFEELRKARRCLVLDTELHVVYLVTPLNSSTQIGQIDWLVFLDIWKSVSESERRVGQLVGVQENFLMNAIRGLTRNDKALNVHKRFYTALALHDLVREVPLGEVCRKYGCCRGLVQSLQQSAATFAGMVTQFCKKLGWDCMELLIGQFQARLQFGVSRELLDLLRLPMLNGLRARSLHREGITSVAELAVANVLDVERGLHKALPFESGKEHCDEHELDAAVRNKMRSVFVTGRDGLTVREAAAILVREARTLVQNELGLEDLPWERRERFSTRIGRSSNLSTINGSWIEKSMCRDTVEVIHDQVQGVESVSTGSRESSDPHTAELDSNPCAHGEPPGNLSRVPGAAEKFHSQGTTAFECPEAIFENDVFPSAYSVNPEEAKKISQLRTEEEICVSDSLEFTGNVNPDGEAIGPGTCEAIRREIMIEVANSAGTLDRRVEPVDIVASPNAPFSKSVATRAISDRGTNLSVCPSRENAATRKLSVMSPIALVRGSLANDPESRSPSLFGDSLNLDTQECDMLERNIIDSLGTSIFEDTNPRGFVDSRSDTPESKREANAPKTRSSSPGRHGSPRMSDRRKSSGASLIWADDSWNAIDEPIGPSMIANEAITPKNNKDSGELFPTPTSNAVPQKLTSRCKSMIDHEDRLLPKSRLAQLQRSTHKRKSSDSTLDLSPLASLLRLSEKRKLSLGSNKSDSDDVVVCSQSTRAPASHAKNRTRQKLESLRKSRIERTVNGRAKVSRNNVRYGLCESCSVDSVISSSEEESPTKRGRTVQPVDQVPEKRVLAATNKTSRKKAAAFRPCKTEVVNVAANWARFNQFKRDLTNKADVALALACETFLNGPSSIGTKIIGVASTDGRKKTRRVENCIYGNKKICGVAISWDGTVAHYVSFDNSNESKVPVKERLALLEDVLGSRDRTVRCFSAKDTYKALYNCCRITSSCKFLDPKTADWLLNPEHSGRSFNALIAEHLAEAKTMTERTGTKDAASSELRAAIEAALTWHLIDALMVKLETCSSKLLHTFRDIEMRTVALLARMELSGLGVNLKSLRELSDVIQREMSQLETAAYTLAGRKFNFSSSKSVAQVLELAKGKKVSTSKAVLEHCENPIARLVVSWRKLSVTQSKVVFPLLRLAEYNSRIHGNCVTDTVTGRISMHEPNLQNVPRDFSSHDDSFVLSVRTAFVPSQSNLILSADYCQLELRILAHFSKEPNLCRILRKEGDVFKNIAARWYNMSEDQIDDDQRQRTKQLCYGMIYGMGTKSLGENLGVSEPEAKDFLETFMGAYPEIRRWLTRVVEEARTRGYVETLMARRRYLPALNSEILSERSQAERQAVNTMVQGSAADIAKKAMVKVDARMCREFPEAPFVLTDIPIKRKLRSSSPEKLARGAFLILQLHDELLYEVNPSDMQRIGKIIKESMEQSCELRVPLPVKVKVGPTWGDLAEIKF